MSRTITFLEPVIVNGQFVTNLTMQRPTVGMEEDALTEASMMDKADNPLTGELCLFGLLCGVAYDDLREFPSWTIDKLRQAYRELNRPGNVPPAAKPRRQRASGKTAKASPLASAEPLPTEPGPEPNPENSEND